MRKFKDSIRHYYYSQEINCIYYLRKKYKPKMKKTLFLFLDS